MIHETIQGICCAIVACILIVTVGTCAHHSKELSKEKYVVCVEKTSETVLCGYKYN